MLFDFHFPFLLGVPLSSGSPCEEPSVSSSICFSLLLKSYISEGFFFLVSGCCFMSMRYLRPFLHLSVVAQQYIMGEPPIHSFLMAAWYFMLWICRILFSFFSFGGHSFWFCFCYFVITVDSRCLYVGPFGSVG